jgi:uncharacterized protein YutD
MVCKVEYITYNLLQAKENACANFGGDRFRKVDLYKVQTQEADKNEQKAILTSYIRRYCAVTCYVAHEREH